MNLESYVLLTLLGVHSCFAWFVFLVSGDGCVALPRGAINLSAVCDCCVS